MVSANEPIGSLISLAGGVMEGVELDKAVAEAVGLTLRNSNGIAFWFEGGKRRKAPTHFRPSADMNDAMWAAEKVGLFNPLKHDLNLSQAGSPLRWFVHRGDDDFVGVGSGDTAAEAICDAILKVAAKCQQAFDKHNPF